MIPRRPLRSPERPRAARAFHALAAAAAFFACAGDASAELEGAPGAAVRVPGGPLAVRDLFLLELPVLGFVPESGDVLGRGARSISVQISEASTYVIGGDVDERIRRREEGLAQGPGYGLVADGEATVVRVDVGFGIGKRTELRASVPVVRVSGGFLDSPIDAWHDTLGLDPGGRDEAPGGEVRAVVLGDGLAYGVPGAPGLDRGAAVGDVVLEARFALPGARDRLRMALAVLAKAPTGDEDRGTGSGHADGGVLFALSRMDGKGNDDFHLSVAALALGGELPSGVRPRDPVHAAFAWEHRFQGPWSFVGQLQGSTGPWPETRALSAHRPRLFAAAGVRRDLGGSAGAAADRLVRLELGILQNVTLTDSQADFTLFAGARFARF